MFVLKGNCHTINRVLVTEKQNRFFLCSNVVNIVIAAIVDKGGQVFNVKAYGAKGDGATNDVVAIQAAIDAAREASDVVKALSGTVQQAEKLLMLAEKGFELGVKTRLEVQDAEQNVNVARANLAAAQRDYRLAVVNLDWVAGVLDGGMAVPPAPVNVSKCVVVSNCFTSLISRSRPTKLVSCTGKLCG